MAAKQRNVCTLSAAALSAWFYGRPFFKIWVDRVERWWSACRISTPQKWRFSPTSQRSPVFPLHSARSESRPRLHLQTSRYQVQSTATMQWEHGVCDLNSAFHVDATWQLQRRICKATRLCQFIWLQHRSWPDHQLAAALKLYFCKKEKKNKKLGDRLILQLPVKLRQSDTESDFLDSILHCQFLLKAYLTKVVSHWGAAKSW